MSNKIKTNQYSEYCYVLKSDLIKYRDFLSYMISDIQEYIDNSPLRYMDIVEAYITRNLITGLRNKLSVIIKDNVFPFSEVIKND